MMYMDMLVWRKIMGELLELELAKPLSPYNLMGLSFRILEDKNAGKMLSGIPGLWGFRKNFLKDSIADFCWCFKLKICSFCSTGTEDLAMITKRCQHHWGETFLSQLMLVIRGWKISVINKRSVPARLNLQQVLLQEHHTEGVVWQWNLTNSL